MAGMISWVSLALFLLGVVLCLIEVFVPGFGVFGVGGIASIAASIFLMAPDAATAVKYLVVMAIMLVVLVPILFKVMKKRKVLDKLMVKEELKTEDGFVSRRADLGQYVNREGRAFTVLRPAGTMITDDGVRLDVVTKGDFIEKDARIRVVGMDGTWLTVEKIEE